MLYKKQEDMRYTVKQIKLLWEQEKPLSNPPGRSPKNTPSRDIKRLKTRDRVAKTLGISAKVLHQLLYIDAHSPKLLEDIPSKYSIAGAYLHVKGQVDGVVYTTVSGIYVYDCAQSDDHHCSLFKIGLSKGIEARMKDATTFNPKGKLIYSYECSADQLKETESIIHHSLSAYSTSYSNEIFALPDGFDFDAYFDDLLGHKKNINIERKEMK